MGICFVKGAKYILSFLPIVLVGVMLGTPVAYAKSASNTPAPDLFIPQIPKDYCFVDSPVFVQPNIPLLEDKKPHSDYTFEAEIGEARGLVQPVEPQITTTIVSTFTPTLTAGPTLAISSQAAGEINVSPSLTASEGKLDADVLFSLVNSYRQSIGLSPFEKDPRVCEIAQMRAPELYGEIVVSHNMHAGLYNRQFPFWVTENMIHIRTEQDAVSWWLHSPIHRRQMLGDYKYACSACIGNSCTLVFSNFTPKNIFTPSPSPTPVIPEPVEPQAK